MIRLLFFVGAVMPFLSACNTLDFLSANGKRTGTPTVLQYGKPLVVIMAGQSNMAGGYNEGRIVPDTPRIRYALPAGSGPVVPFSEALVSRHPQLNLIIIHCAVSGTYISQWRPGGLIEPCLMAARAEIDAGRGVAGGFIFLQGEADAKFGEDPKATYAWGMEFTALARYVRSSLQAPALPIVLGHIGRVTLPGFPHWDHIKQEQSAVSLPALAHVSTDGVALIDGIHYDQPGYALVGQRFADAFSGLLLDA